jgi:hypothetical protein
MNLWEIRYSKQNILEVLRYPVDFEIISEIRDIETIAVGQGIRDRARLRKTYGRGRWRKLKGVGQVHRPSPAF